jgi:hypothetical protein
MRKLLFLASLLLLAGCTSTITNLTPGQLPRNSTGLYPVEVAWTSREHVIKHESIKPYVIIGTEAYPMRVTPIVSNRWETLIPVPADQNIVNYRFKVDYLQLRMPEARMNSKLSPEYKLQIK